MEIDIQETLNLAVEKHNQGKLGEAEIIYRKILAVNPENADAWHLLGLIASQTEHYQESITLINQAIKLKEDAIFYHNLAMTYDKLGNSEKSAENFLRAIQINPGYETAHLAYYNLGVYYKDKGKLQEAIEYYDRAISLNPEFVQAHLNKGLILLLLENFKQGWKEYEYRLKINERKFDKPEWQGEQGKTVLVVCEQGLGDDIQFVRYLPLIKQKNCKVIFECKKELRKLFNNIKDINQFADKAENYDYYIHLMSLPRIFSTDLINIPRILDLNVNTREIKSNKLKIGICWHGNPNQENDKNRSTKPEFFKMLEMPGVELYSLQKGESGGFIELSGINSFEETASIIKGLDLIISVDTSIVHLAGTLNKPVWTLLCFTPDWRWLLNREDNLWYPSMKLFRQKKSGDWQGLFEEVKEKLIEFKSNYS